MTTHEKNPDAIARLSPEQYHVTQQNGTERPGFDRFESHPR
jgi:peptide-methionine (R)-S-oxide reductase